jgi:hypothetical protein
MEPILLLNNGSGEKLIEVMLPLLSLVLLLPLVGDNNPNAARSLLVNVDPSNRGLNASLILLVLLPPVLVVSDGNVPNGDVSDANADANGDDNGPLVFVLAAPPGVALAGNGNPIDDAIAAAAINCAKKAWSLIPLLPLAEPNGDGAASTNPPLLLLLLVVLLAIGVAGAASTPSMPRPPVDDGDDAPNND